MLDKKVLFIAQESDGCSHFRGIGYLVLTDDELYFERQLRSKIISIPITSLRNVEETRRLAGQAPGKSMLRIVFKDSFGNTDSIALCIKDLEQWKIEIAALIYQ
ncbi:hypothetical protein ACFL4L_03650 [bacterium]